MNKVTALEFQRNLGKYQREAQRGPIEITNHGRRDLVLLSAEYFDWLSAAVKRSHKTADGENEFLRDAIKNTRMDSEHDHLNSELDG
jgi:prevent-host-death family protein